MGSDHRAVYCNIKLDTRLLQKWRRESFSKKSSSLGWASADASEYKRLLDERVQDINCERLLKDGASGLEELCKQLNATFAETAFLCRGARVADAVAKHECSTNHVQQLCAERNLLAHGSRERM